MKPVEIIVLGFSQGACLALEYAARNPLQYGGIIALSGALITLEHNGEMKNTPVFIGCSDDDPHIPLERVLMTTKAFEKMKAHVTKKIYHKEGHRINEDEIAAIKKIIKETK